MEMFVTCSQGLEPLLADELKELGCKSLRTGYRGVSVQEATFADVYRVNYCSRLGGRVLLPLTRFRCLNRDALYKEVDAIDWSSWIGKGKTIAIDANVTHKQFRNSLFAAQVAKDAICDQLRHTRGERPSVNTKDPDVQLNLFIREPWATLYLDTSGQPLHKRGYRLDGGFAPLQESLAAALLKLAQYEEKEILCDPCCGSGTLLIEAALMAAAIPPGFLRLKWGFHNHPDYSQAEWLQIKAEADRQRKPLLPGHFFGCELNKEMARVAKVNLRAAGLHQQVEVATGDFRTYTPAVQPTFVIVNPPHGKRLEEVEALKPLYRALGEFFKRVLAKPGRAFVFTGDLDLSKEVGLASKKRHVIDNSGIDSRFLEFEIF